MDNELLLYDRLNVIKDTINKYGADNFYISFSGGKDSTVLHYLIDMALPGNTIPRVFINTGIEYIDIVKFVRSMAEKDSRFEIVNAGVNIKQMLNTYGYPFKSKDHAKKVDYYWRHKELSPWLEKYLDPSVESRFHCPDILRYQFTPENKLHISNLCCDKMKKATAKHYEKSSGKTARINGMRKAEGGQRAHNSKVGCILIKDGTIKSFAPLIKVDDAWEQWFIDKYNIQLCKLYYEPYNFKRTGCKGCPFALNLQEQLETMEKYLLNERKQCEIIWKPVYDEYRRIGYRLKKDEQLKLF